MRIQRHLQKSPITQEGLQKLLDEQAKLLAERPEAVSELKKAREMGDLSENGYYKGARAKLSHIDSRLRHLKHLIFSSKVIEKSLSDEVTLGSTVTVKSVHGEQTFTIVGKHESNSLEGKISHVSPLGSQLLNKKVGEKVILQTPKGETEYTIVGLA